MIDQNHALTARSTHCVPQQAERVLQGTFKLLIAELQKAVTAEGYRSPQPGAGEPELVPAELPQSY